MSEPQPQFVGPAGQSSLTPPDKRGAGLTDRDQVNVWAQDDDPGSRFAPDLQPSAAGVKAVGEQPAFSDSAGPPLPSGARGVFPRSLANHLQMAMRVATMPTPPVVVDDFRLFERPGDQLAVGPQPAGQEALPTDEHALPGAADGDTLGAESTSSPYAGGITLHAEGAQASGPQIAAETPSQQAPTLDTGRGTTFRRPAVGPFGSSLVSLGSAAPTGAQGESRLMRGSVLAARTAEEQS